MTEFWQGVLVGICATNVALVFGVAIVLLFLRGASVGVTKGAGREVQVAAWKEASAVARRTSYMSDNSLRGGDHGGPANCEYGCGKVIADYCDERVKEIEVHS